MNQRPRHAIGSVLGMALVVLLVGPGIVSAQPVEESGMGAQEAYKKGVEHFDNGDYEKAAEYFRYAVDKKSHPVLHFNLAQAYARTGQWERAFRQGRKAEQVGDLDEKTSAANRGTMAAGRVVVAAQAFEPPSEEPSPRASESTPSAQSEPGSSGPQPEPEPSEGEGPLSALGYGGIGTVAGGLGMLTGAIFVDKGLSEDFAARRAAGAAGNQTRVEELSSTIRSKQTTGKILLYGGSGLAVVGTALVIADLTVDSGSLGGRRVRWFVAPRSRGWRAGVTFPF